MMLVGVSVSADLESHLSSTTPPAITVRLKEPGRTSPRAHASRSSLGMGSVRDLIEIQ